VQAIVHHLSDCMARGATVVDRESGQERPLAWRDVMVLVPRWSHGQDIAEELERLGIECAVEGGGGFFADPSVQACLAGLRAVDEPADLESMVACLRTLFGLTLEDLAKHKAAEGSFRWTVREQPAGPVADAARNDSRGGLAPQPRGRGAAPGPASSMRSSMRRGRRPCGRSCPMGPRASRTSTRCARSCASSRASSAARAR
jgi:hypothetical protein